ncbi:MAG: DUF4340 domain-containing protein [Clostridia bacterium]|nr:DUF4340 domain-containing protein [Clostridia bacterium]
MKPMKTLAIVLTIVLVLIAGFVVLNMSEQSPQEQEQTPQTTLETVVLFETGVDAIAEIEMRGKQESYTLSRTNDDWVLDGDSSLLLDKAKVDSLVNSCAYIIASKEIAENVTDVSAYGLADPYKTVDIRLKDGTVTRVIIGNETADASMRYLMLAGGTSVYTKSTYAADALAPAMDSLRNKKLYAVSEETVNYLSVAREGTNTYAFKRLKKEDGSWDVIWNMQEPFEKVFNEYTFTEELLPGLLSLTADSIVADYPKALGQYGLNQPYATVTVKDDEKSHTIHIGSRTESGSRYVKYADSHTVYLMSESKLAFLNIGYLQLIDKLIHVVSIEEVNEIRVKGENAEYLMKIEGASEPYTYKINGKELEEKTFKMAYQSIIGIVLDDYTNAPQNSGAEKASIRYRKKDGNTILVAFHEWDERNYLVRVNGKGSMICRKKQVSGLIDTLAKYAG